MNDKVEQIKAVYKSVGMNVPIVMASSLPVAAFLAPILDHTERLDEKSINVAKDHARKLAFTSRKALIQPLINQYRDVLTIPSRVIISQSGSTNTAFLRAWRDFRDKEPNSVHPFIMRSLSTFTNSRIHSLWGRTKAKFHPIIWLNSDNYLMWPNKRFAVVSEPPVQMLYNNLFQFHSTDDLAIKWGDGWGLALINGTQISSRFILKPASLTVDVINKTVNVEVKRALMELYGFERWLTETSATLLHEDKDQDLRPRRLWKLIDTIESDVWARRASINLLEVFNSTPELDGHHKKYFLSVPGDITSVEVALKWMLDVRMEFDVHPLIET